MESRRNLSVAWLDFRKAYDVVPHQWVKDLLAAVRAPELVQRSVGKVMGLWRTDLEVMTEAGTARIGIQFRRGLFQGDALSPLLFVMAVAQLSSLLGIAGVYSVAHHASPITHLLFMDDLKVLRNQRLSWSPRWRWRRGLLEQWACPWG